MIVGGCTQGQSNETYLEALGFQRNAEGALESQESYTERMCAIVGLYSALAGVPVSGTSLPPSYKR